MHHKNLFYIWSNFKLRGVSHSAEKKSPWKPEPKSKSDAKATVEGRVKTSGAGNLDPWASSRNKFKS